MQESSVLNAPFKKAQGTKYRRGSILLIPEKVSVSHKANNLKDKFGFEKILHAAELTKTPVLKDVIGFGSVKDLF